MCRIGEVRAVAYGHQDRGSDPHTHPGDGCQDFIKREGIDHLVDLGGDQVALFLNILMLEASSGIVRSMALVPGTTTVCWSNAWKIAATRSVWSPRQRRLIQAVTRLLPAARSLVGPP